ncbi:MAG: glycoside hydrolase family 16 protein [Acidobacteria bacterium]|nr:glycoside hydrolase family 16 protein [Acidobacteriota bacterium]MBI3428397.1 glycoside hydrolase family 16 protein [Acidobacteriota bacterium]
MKIALTLLLTFNLLLVGSGQNRPVQIARRADWKLVWADEFNYKGLPDPKRWEYKVGGDGWGNNELQYYTSGKLANARVEGGNLVIEARKEKINSNNYTSARLVTAGKGDWTYGRFEIRARLPAGRGTWPAIWMLPSKTSYSDRYWPDNGEIDIMEHVGHDPGVIHASTHTKAYNWPRKNQKTATLKVPDAQTAFHTYALEWSAEKLDVYIDDTKIFSDKNEGSGWEAWPFDQNFHLVLNLAIGGFWGGAEGVDDTIFPQRMEIDYVRVYQQGK